MNKQRFYIDTEGNDDVAYREAIQFACKLADDDPGIARIVLLVATKRTTGWFERLFGENTVKQLFSGVKFKNCRPVIKLESLQTFRAGNVTADAIITCGLDDKDVLKIDDCYSAKVIIAVPWLREYLQKWIQTWNPADIRSNQNSSAYPEPSCIVKKAMESLTASINMSTGIHHPSDEDRAKTFIRALHKYEPSLDANLVGAYLIRELGWTTNHAQDVEKLIETLNAGRYFRGGEKTGLSNYYKRWKELCK